MAGLISIDDISGDYFRASQKKSPGRKAGAFGSMVLVRCASVALAEQLQQQREQVDEVQVERQGAGNGRTLCHVTARAGIAIDVVVLQPLGIVGSEAREYQDADHRHQELQHRTSEEEIDQ